MSLKSHTFSIVTSWVVAILPTLVHTLSDVVVTGMVTAALGTWICHGVTI